MRVSKVERRVLRATPPPLDQRRRLVSRRAMQNSTDDQRDLRYRTCPLCEAMCGLELEIEGDRVARLRPDDADVWS
jgi:anaerobic selenocysteine-containing dehydrogenase